MSPSELWVKRQRAVPSEGDAPAAILLVDDSGENLSAIESVLEGLADSVVRANSGQEALARLLERDFALILLDVRMPDIDGFEVASLIRKQHRLKNLPIVFVTAFDPGPGDIERAYELGSVDFVIKPVSPVVLRSKVRTLVELHRYRSGIERMVIKRTKELQRVNEELRLTNDAIPGLVSVIGKDERYIRVNRCYETWFGVPPEKIEGRTLRDVLGEDAYQAIQKHVECVLSGREVSFESLIPYRTGGARHVRASYVPYRDASGVVTAFMAFITDVTEIKRAGEAVRRNEQELSDFFENAAVGCHCVGPDGTILKANGTELRMLGYAREEYVGHHIAEFHADGAVVDDLMRRLWNKESLRDYPARLRSRKGEIKEVLLDATVLWRDGEFIHTRSFTRDMTDYRRGQDAQSRLVAIVQSSDDAIIGKTLEGIVTSWNRGAESLFGYKAEEIIGRPILTLIPEHLRSEETEILARLKKGERVDHYETRRQTKDGRLVDISLTVSPVKDAEGRIIGASKIARDITDRRRMEEERSLLFERERVARQMAEKAETELRALNADLETRVQERTSSLQGIVRELDSFAYTVAHDLRAPLRAVHTLGQMLLEEEAPALSEAGKKYLAEMIHAGGRMDQLIGDLLAYSRLSRQELPLEPLDLGATIDRALLDLRPELTERKAQVKVERPLPRVLGNAVTLSQTITNLVSNAAKFVAPGMEPRITLRAERREGLVRLWVEDNGIGVAPEHQGRLFKVFERLHGREEYPGTGIGLAIVRRAMERMGGRVGLESAVGQGSRFWIDLAAPENS